MKTRTVRSVGAAGTEWKTVTTETRTVTEGGRSTRFVTTEETTSLAEHFDSSVSFQKAANVKTPEKQSKSLFSVLKSKPMGACGSSTPPAANAAEFEKQSLAAHNAYRSKHGVPPLKLSKSLCKYANEWVTQLAREDSFQHRPGNKYGENIFMKWTSDPTYQLTGAEAVDSWYSEIKDHVFGREPSSLKSGHFTQVVWKESRELGVAQAKSKTGKLIVVANYDPAGNMMGSFAPNVPPPK